MGPYDLIRVVAHYDGNILMSFAVAGLTNADSPSGHQVDGGDPARGIREHG